MINKNTAFKQQESFSDMLQKNLNKIKARQEKSIKAYNDIISQAKSQATSQAKTQEPQAEPTFKVIIDNGKPSETTANGEIELRAVLKQQYAESQKTDYAYFDIKVYDDKGTDLSESQFITEIIGEIMNEESEDKSEGEKWKGVI